MYYVNVIAGRYPTLAQPSKLLGKAKEAAPANTPTTARTQSHPRRFPSPTTFLLEGPSAVSSPPLATHPWRPTTGPPAQPPVSSTPATAAPACAPLALLSQQAQSVVLGVLMTTTSMGATWQTSITHMFATIQVGRSSLNFEVFQTLLKLLLN